MDDHHTSQEPTGAFANVEDPLIGYRQPIVTASGLMLAFTLGFASLFGDLFITFLYILHQGNG
jgi:hypothetical protein